MNFAVLGFIDPFELVGSLRTKMGLFQPGEPRLLPIRGPRKGADDPDDDTGFVAYGDTAKKWVELRSMLAKISRLGEPMGGVDIGRVFMQMLMPGICLPWDMDDGAYTARFSRLHMALRTNPAAMMFSGVEAMNPLPGQLVLVNQRARHSAINLGEWPVVHLVVDFRQKNSPASLGSGAVP